MLSDPEFFECELLTVSREQAELAASEISGCEACNADAEVFENARMSHKFRHGPAACRTTARPI